MSIPDEILILISGIGAIQSAFLAIYISSHKKGKPILNALLSLLFLCLAIRVGKSVLWLFWNETPLWILNIGFAAHAAIGPAALLYTYYSLFRNYKFNFFNLIQFTPAFLILILTNYIGLNNFWYVGGYTSLLFYHLLYMAVCFGIVFYAITIKKFSYQLSEIKWILSLLIGVTILVFAYFSNYILGLTSYALGPLLYSGIIYLLSFYCFKYQNKLNNITEQTKQKYKNLNINSEEASVYKQKLIQIMEDKKPFLDSEFTLSKLSNLVMIPTYILSHIINDEIKLNFSEFTNHYRIKEAKVKLKDPINNNLKIAAIAYDCGFNSLSSFNTAFKKFTNMTPSQFKSQKA